MKMKSSLAGSAIAFLLATSCCWLPWLAVVLGGALGLGGFAAGLESWSGVFYAIAAGLLVWSGYQFWQSRKESSAVELSSTITCPECGFSKKETMPTDACQFFYECENCKVILKPLAGDCCVYCSYGTVQCPPMQTGDCHC